jgi:hypothetical protein
VSKTKISHPLPTVDVAVNDYDFEAKDYVETVRKCEVLTVHFLKRTMRVRYYLEEPRFFTRYKGTKPRAVDIDATPYFAKYGEPRP